MSQSEEAVEELYDCYTKTAANVIRYYKNEERKDMLKELREIVKINCKHDSRLKKIEEAKNRLLELHDTNDMDTDIESVIKEYKDVVSRIRGNKAGDKETKLLEYDRQVDALLEDNEDREEADGDGDLALTGGYVNVIDPISKKRIVNPVKNTVCGHTYDRDTIKEMLKINKETRCPVIGCKSKEFVALAKLRTDIVVKTYLDKHPA